MIHCKTVVEYTDGAQEGASAGLEQDQVNRIELLIFDLDGTLIDSQEDIILAVNYTRRTLGLEELERERIISHIGYGVVELIKRSLGQEHEALFDRGLEVFSEYYPRHAADHTRLYPHVKETLEYFRAVPKLIITNKRTELAEQGVRVLGIADYFKEVIGGDDESCQKPSPCPILDALKKYNVPAGRAMIVGDMDVDVQAGKNAGIHTCAVTYGIGRREDIEKAAPDYMLEGMEQLREIVVRPER